PTPRFLEGEIGLGSDGLGPPRLHYYPPWLAMRSPQLRGGQSPPEQPPKAETAPRLAGGAAQTHPALQPAHSRAQPRTAPPPQAYVPVLTTKVSRRVAALPRAAE